MSNVSFRIKRGSSGTWASKNLTLSAGEFGLEKDTRIVKVGDGSTPWKSLRGIAVNAADVVGISAYAAKANVGLSYDKTSKKITLDADGHATEIDATDFIKDGMIQDVTYDPATKKITITFNTESGKEPIVIDVSDLVDTYTAGEGLSLSANVFSIDETKVATVTALGAAVAAETAAREAADNAIDARIKAAEDSLSGYVTKAAAEAEHQSITAQINAISTDYLKGADKAELQSAIDAVDGKLTGYVTTDAATAAHTAIDGKVDGILSDYLKGSDKTELTTKIETVDAKLSDYITAADASAAHAEIEGKVDEISGDYLKASDKTELEGKIETKADASALTAVDCKVEGILSDYLKEEDKTALEEEIGEVDAKLVNYVLTVSADAEHDAIKERLTGAENAILQRALSADVTAEIASVNETIDAATLAYSGETKKITLKIGGAEQEIDATDFIKDGMVESARYDADAKVIVISFNTDAGKTPIAVDVAAMVHEYTAGTGLTSDGSVFSVNPAEVTMVSTFESTIDELYEAAAKTYYTLEAAKDLSARVDTIQGDGEGSIAKALSDANDHADEKAGEVQANLDATDAKVDGILSDYLNEEDKNELTASITAKADLTALAATNATLAAVSGDYLKTSDKSELTSAIGLKLDASAVEGTVALSSQAEIEASLGLGSLAKKSTVGAADLDAGLSTAIAAKAEFSALATIGAKVDGILSDYLKVSDKTALMTEIGKKLDQTAVAGKVALSSQAEIEASLGLGSLAKKSSVSNADVADKAITAAKLGDTLSSEIANKAEVSALDATNDAVAAISVDYVNTDEGNALSAAAVSAVKAQLKSTLSAVTLSSDLDTVLSAINALYAWANS